MLSGYNFVVWCFAKRKDKLMFVVEVL
jgi:hypothetical protein